MKFKTVQEAFNYYRNHEVKDIETRAAEIGNLINTDPDADIKSLNIELDGLKEAKENIETRSAMGNKIKSFNPVTGMNFNNDDKAELPKDEAIFETKEYRSAFYKSLLGQNLNEIETRAYNQAMETVEVERRADQFNTTTNSAAVLPTHTLNEVIKKARTMGGLISHARSFNLPTNLSIPIGTPSTKAEWHTEGTPVESEKADTENVNFGGYELIKIFSISAAAKKMTISAFESYLIDELTNCVMEAIADSLINGTGTGQGKGIDKITWTKNANKFEYAKGSIPKYTDFTNMLAKLKRGYGTNAKFVMSNATLYNHVYSIVDLNERPIFITDPKNEKIGYILGKEVVIDDNMKDGDIILGNFEYMGYNMPQGIMIEVSRESSFKSGLIDYRALAIADTKPLVEEAFIKLTEAAA